MAPDEPVTAVLSQLRLLLILDEMPDDDGPQFY
jgi:hypothetical protein